MTESQNKPVLKHTTKLLAENYCFSYWLQYQVYLTTSPLKWQHGTTVWHHTSAYGVYREGKLFQVVVNNQIFNMIDFFHHRRNKKIQHAFRVVSEDA